MTSPETETLRTVDLTRESDGAFEVTNHRGGRLSIGVAGDDFTPVELLLASLAACAAVNVEEMTRRRAEPTTFNVRAEGHKVREEDGSRMVGLRLVFDIEFPDGDGGDAARAIVPRVLRQTRDRICTVSRTVHLGGPVEYAQTERG